MILYPKWPWCTASHNWIQRFPRVIFSLGNLGVLKKKVGGKKGCQARKEVSVCLKHISPLSKAVTVVAIRFCITLLLHSKGWRTWVNKEVLQQWVLHGGCEGDDLEHKLEHHQKFAAGQNQTSGLLITLNTKQMRRARWDLDAFLWRQPGQW